jgi:protease-4
VKRFWIVFLTLTLIVFGGIGLLWLLVDRYTEEPRIAGGVLVWRVEGEYPEVRDENLVGQLRHGYRPTMKDVLFALDRAGRDPRIRGLLLDVRDLAADWAKVEELRGQVERFRHSGKPVLAFVATPATKEYVLATAADRLVLAPEGALRVFGVAAEMVFLKETLAKVGVEADFVHIGRYKTAPEQWTRSEPSEAGREMYESIVADRYERVVATIAAGRGVEAATARAWIDSGLFDAPTALAEGLVDTLGYREDLIDRFLPDEKVTELADYARERPHGRTHGVVALVNVAGTIMPGKSRDDTWQGRFAGEETVIERLRIARDDPDVSAVVLRVDSPGGSALASDAIWNAVAEVRAAKPVVVSMSGYAASGGYYVSCGADSVFAGAATLTGSIGVFAGKMDLSGLYAKLGVHRLEIARGENVGFFSEHTRFSAQQRRRLEAQLERFYTRFVDKVATGRGLEPEAVAAVAQGRVWTGSQAVECGLVDRIGGLFEAIRAAKQLAGIPSDQRVSVLTFERHLGWLEHMLLRLFDDLPAVRGTATASPLPAPLLGVARELAASGCAAYAELPPGTPVALPPCHVVLR